MRAWNADAMRTSALGGRFLRGQAAQGLGPWKLASHLYRLYELTVDSGKSSRTCQALAGEAGFGCGRSDSDSRQTEHD